MTLTIIRGLPGSGKTTLAKALGVQYFEADQYFMVAGTYTFRREEIKDAHEWCQEMVRDALMRGEDVAVANTFSQKWEAQPYLEMAQESGADVQIIECYGRWRSVHEIPDHVVAKMAERWESSSDWVSLESNPKED
ncbi:MAG: AAA family ATPase [Gammaproteobacteria bacterium]|jgi:predicted kinase